MNRLPYPDPVNLWNISRFMADVCAYLLYGIVAERRDKMDTHIIDEQSHGYVRGDGQYCTDLVKVRIYTKPEQFVEIRRERSDGRVRAKLLLTWAEARSLRNALAAVTGDPE
jgi:hypothetical protein